MLQQAYICLSTGPANREMRLAFPLHDIFVPGLDSLLRSHQRILDGPNATKVYRHVKLQLNAQPLQQPLQFVMTAKT